VSFGVPFAIFLLLAVINYILEGRVDRNIQKLGVHKQLLKQKEKGLVNEIDPVLLKKIREGVLESM
jgi:hypothetical protein